MKISVTTSTNSYEVLTGRGLINELKSHLPQQFLDRKILIVTDDNVASLYLERAKRTLPDAYIYIVAHGEASKSFENAEKICTYLAASGFTRKDCVIALGGGVIGDLAGFVASIYMRGIPYVQVPTTLLAGIDSSIGGKTAVNLPYGKNLVGRIYPPRGVVFDLDTMDTLPAEFMRDGIGEGLKYALLEGGELFNIMDGGLTADNFERFTDLCIGCKKRVVEADENESGLRRLLNLGHTVGHAIERRSELTITHGVCVSIGLRVVLNACKKARYLPDGEFNKAIELLNKYSVPENTYPINELTDSIKVDKKTDRDTVNLVTVHAIGDCRVTPVALSDLEKFLC